MNYDLESWKEVHRTLKKAVQIAQVAVAVQAAQRRFWLEELNANLGDENISSKSSVWKKPYVLRKKDIIVVKKSVNVSTGAASKPFKRKAAAQVDSDGQKPTKKPRKKKQIDEKRATTTKVTKAAVKKVKKKKVPLPRSLSSPEENDDDTMSEHSYEPDPSEHSFHDNSERSFPEKRPSSTASTAAANMYEYHRPSSVVQHPSAYHPHEYHQPAPMQKRTSPPAHGLAWGAPIPTATSTADAARNLQMMAAVAAFGTASSQQPPQEYPPHPSPAHPMPPYGWNTNPGPAYHPHRNYASIHDVASDEDDSDQDRF